MSNTIEKAIDRAISRRQVTRLMHGHLSPQLWEEPGRLEVPDILKRWETEYQDSPRSLSVYVGTPYCLPTEPDRCGFCLFPSEEYKGGSQLEDYLELLRLEGEMYKPYLQTEKVDAIYFGGGTSNLYKARQYSKLLGIVRGVFPNLSPDIEITLEGIPQTFTKEKLIAMQNEGVNRVSMGVQQFDDELIKFSGRKQTRAHTVRVLEAALELGLRTSIDLIYGWPTQTMEQMLKDLETTVELGVNHFTHYELNVGGRTDFAENHADTLPSLELNREMYHVANEYLRGKGYTQVSTYDWQLDGGRLSYEEDTIGFWLDEKDRLHRRDQWGWGFAGISTFPGTPDKPGWLWMNHEKMADYTSAVRSGEFPAGRIHDLNTEDMRLRLLFSDLLNRRIHRRVYSTLFGTDVLEQYREFWDELIRRDWLKVDDETMTIEGDGVFYTPALQGVLATSRVREVQRALIRSSGSLQVVS